MTIKTKETQRVVRKQVLVLEVNFFLKPSDQERIIESVRAQMETGVVLLPTGIRAKTVDADCVLIAEGEDADGVD